LKFSFEICKIFNHYHKICGKSIDNLFLHCMVASCYIIVEHDLTTICYCVGNAAINERDVGELEGAKGQPVVDADLEN